MIFFSYHKSSLISMPKPFWHKFPSFDMHNINADKKESEFGTGILTNPCLCLGAIPRADAADN